MTFIELINELKIKYGEENENIFYEMFSFLSSRYKSKNDIIISLRKEIDFSIKDINKICNKYFNNKVPIEYITNKTFFIGFDFFVNKKVLIPRKETEFLVSKIIDEYTKNKNINVLDLCCGSGVIGLSIKKKIPSSNVVLVDKYNGPINVSKINKNKHNLNVNIIKRDLKKYFNNSLKFDLIISNPPYINKKFILDKYVKKEPKKALFANDDGLELIKFIIDNYYNMLTKNGSMYIEFGFDQKEYIENYVINKYKYEFIIDQYNIYRFIKIIKD